MKTLLHPRGTTLENDEYLGKKTQIAVDTERDGFRVHDDETLGGHVFENFQRLSDEHFILRDSEFGNLFWTPSDRGFMVRVGDKTWRLRALAPGDGIKIENPTAENGNAKISIDEEWLLAHLVAGRLVFVDYMEGVNSAFTLTLPEAYEEVDGSVFATRFHLDPADNATLSINEAEALPIRFANGSRKLSNGMKAETLVLFIKGFDSYYMIGEREVQPAVEGLSTLHGWFNFGEPEAGWRESTYGNRIGGTSSSLNQSNIGLDNGECIGVVGLYSASNSDQSSNKMFHIAFKLDGIYYVTRPYAGWYKFPAVLAIQQNPTGLAGFVISYEPYRSSIQTRPSLVVPHLDKFPANLDAVYAPGNIYYIGDRIRRLGTTFNWSVHRRWMTPKGVPVTSL